MGAHGCPTEREEEVTVARPVREADLAIGQDTGQAGEVLDDVLVEEVSIDGMCGVY